MEIRNKLIWVTGASSGIGRAVCLKLASKGADLVITARDQDRLAALKEELLPLGVSVLLAPGDVCDLERMKSIANEHSAIDILIANAGDYVPSEIDCFNSGQYKSLMDVNYGGLLHCMEAVIPEMIKRGSGVICGVSSVVGYRGIPKAAAYGASKAAMSYFLESARFDLEPHGIKVTVISPGFVKTPLTDKNEFKMPFLVSPEFAANKIVTGIENERLEIHFPWQLSWICKFFRVLPYRLYHFLLSKSPLVKKDYDTEK